MHTSPTRRAAIAALLGTTALLSVVAACTTAAPLTPAEIVTQATAIGTGLLGMISNPTVTAIITKLSGGSGILATLTGYLSKAVGAAGTLSANLPATTGASIASQIDGYINAFLTTVDSPPLVGLIPSPFNLALTAATVLLPPIEQFINQYLPASVTTAPTVPVPAPAVVAATRLKFGAIKPAMGAPEALAVLQGYAPAAK